MERFGEGVRSHWAIENNLHWCLNVLFHDDEYAVLDRNATENRQTPLQDGTKKIIINAEAFSKSEDAELKGFLEYLKTGAANTEYTGRIETMIQTVKKSEQARQEYRFMSGFEMDARDKGFSDGSRQAKLETAKRMRTHNYPVAEICAMTGLSEAEVEKL